MSIGALYLGLKRSVQHIDIILRVLSAQCNVIVRNKILFILGQKYNLHLRTLEIVHSFRNLKTSKVIKISIIFKIMV